MANKDFKVKNGLDVSTPIPVSMGGTGQTSTANALNSMLPSQSGNSNKVYQRTELIQLGRHKQLHIKEAEQQVDQHLLQQEIFIIIPTTITLKAIQQMAGFLLLPLLEFQLA